MEAEKGDKSETDCVYFNMRPDRIYINYTGAWASVIPAARTKLMKATYYNVAGRYSTKSTWDLPGNYSICCET